MKNTSIFNSNVERLLYFINYKPLENLLTEHKRCSDHQPIKLHNNCPGWILREVPRVSVANGSDQSQNRNSV